MLWEGMTTDVGNTRWDTVDLSGFLEPDRSKRRGAHYDAFLLPFPHELVGLGQDGEGVAMHGPVNGVHDVGTNTGRD